MAIFGKKKDDLASQFEALDLASNESKEAGSGNSPMFGGGGNARKPAAPKPGYGIDHAMKLVHSLQEHKVAPAVIASIMKQTLESVNIHFSEIIVDAQNREAEIKTENERKDIEIHGLMEKLEGLKSEKVKLMDHLNDTVSVRQFLQQAVPEARQENRAEQQQPHSQPEAKPQTSHPGAHKAAGGH